jgi:hypothetical protein
VDVNGTRFHLLKGEADWQRCWEDAAPSAAMSVGYDRDSASLTLAPVLTLFPRGARDEPLDAGTRRGAAVDGFGNWYWIAQDRQRLTWRPAGSERSTVYFDPAEIPAPASAPGAFVPAPPLAAPVVELSGLAVTEDHYLLVGDRGTQAGLIVIDLHAGAPPWRLFLPGGVPFDPWDVAPAPGGGVWILDRNNGRYWGLDRALRVVTVPVAEGPPATPPAGSFAPETGEALPVAQPEGTAEGFALAEVDMPLSIVGLPDYTVLILDSPELDSPPGTGVSVVHHYAYDTYLGSYPLQDEIDVATLDGQVRLDFSLVGHDMAYDAGSEALVVLERDGNQAIAWTLALDASPPGVRVRRDYLPVPYGGGRALVSGRDGVYYDVGGRDAGNDGLVRWLRIRAIERTRYARAATILVGQPPAEGSPPADAPLAFDGKERDCVWHRLLLDACIPPETAVRVWSRAHNDLALLENVPFSREPDLYLRGNGAELPFYHPYPEKEAVPPGTGTWELLLQRAEGRYLQLKLELAGNGRVTPRLRTLRAYYPRFSYPANYLPAIYHDEEEPGPFLERMLANMEGTFTEIEGKIEHAAALFDPRSAPPEALDWLAGWVGLMLDPMWGQLQEKRAEDDERLLAPPGSTRLPDRRRLFIRFARLLYERRGTPDGILFALQLLLEPCLEQFLAGLQHAAVDCSHPLRTVLAFYGLRAPTATTSATAFEELLYALVLRRPSRVRLVERFLVRRGQGRAAGLPDIAEGGDAVPVGSSRVAFAANAHRFTVLVPVTLPPEEEAMVRRIISLEKPAHTEFSLRRYWEGFRVDEARLGIDTTLDQTNRFVAMLLGRDYLAEGYLPASHPQTVMERLVADRDRYGSLPRL